MLNNGFLQSKPPRFLLPSSCCRSPSFMGLPGQRSFPQNVPLAQVPAQFGSWTMQQEGVVEQEVQDVLKADELLTRSYVSMQQQMAAHLFVAYFRSQRTGQTPHSPKNCLPGSGWVPSVSDMIISHIPGRRSRSRPIVMLSPKAIRRVCSLLVSVSGPCCRE